MPVYVQFIMKDAAKKTTLRWNSISWKQEPTVTLYNVVLFANETLLCE